MRSRWSATPEIAVKFRPTRRSADISSLAEPGEIDAYLYLSALCKHLQTIYLDRRGIDCVVDSDGVGRLPEAVSRMLGLMVCELVQDASECSHPVKSTPGTIRVTLRRRGTTCLCTISCRGLTNLYAEAQPGLQRVRGLAAELRESCLVRPMPDRGTIAIMFDVHWVERCFPAAIWRYRVSEAWRRARGHPCNVLE